MKFDTSSVLVVDDVVPNVKLLSAILHSRRFNVYEAANGPDALAIAEERLPAIVILDVMMPGMDGFEVCQKLKANPKTADCAVIYISAKNSAEDKIKGLELGAVDYITKPFQKAEVLARVETHMALQIAKARLKESESLYATLVESVQDGIVLWSPDAGILFANMAFKRMAGASCDDALKLESVVCQKDLSPFVEKLSDALASKSQAPLEIEIGIKRAGAPEGAQLKASCLIVGVEIAGKPAALATVRDMTERLLYERHLQHTQKMEALGLLSSGIAHDFNNVLALVNGYAELALLELGPDGSVADKLRNIIAAGRNAVSLTRGLLSFTKSKGMELEPLELGTELKRLHETLSKAMPKNVKFECRASEQPLPAMADAAMFQQMIANLCLNARDAMPSGGMLFLSSAKVKAKRCEEGAQADEEADFAAITVSDTGCGIPEDLKSKVFDPFFTTKTNGKAAGLGLTVADRIARSHRGWIDFESAEGAGSSFRILLPLSARHEVRERPPCKLYKHGKRAELEEIMIADCDEAELAITSYFLDKEGYKSSSAGSAKDAFDAIVAEPGRFKLLIVSRCALQKSPELTVSEIRKALPELKLLLISDSGAIPVSDVPLLKKPFAVKDLLQALDRL